MPRFLATFAALCLAVFSAAAAETLVSIPAPSTDDDGAQVAILGYHEFSTEGPETAMRIDTDKFRKQMQVLKDLNLPVISLDDFAAWKRGEKSIPPRSILITMDDGWRSVYTDAFPILKEFGYPFTLFLYKNYVDGGRKALTSAMVQEMMEHGASIGSHSTSHPYPATVKKFRAEGEDAFDRFLQTEFGDSKRFLEERFDVKITTYAYPGGFHTPEMIPMAEGLGYQFLFTVQPAKTRRTTANAYLPRYIILGNYDRIFELATTFRDSPTAHIAAGTLSGLTQTTPFPVLPEAGAIINSRLPLVSADLSSIENLDPKSVRMAIAGFGEVPAKFDESSGLVSWQVNRRLRQRFTQVVVNYRLLDSDKNQPPLRWSFQIDRDSAYLPGGGAPAASTP